MLPMSGLDSAQAAPPRRRRRRAGWLVVAVVLVVVIVAGVIVAEVATRAYARDYIRDQLATAFALPADHPMDVELGGGSFVLQVLSGTLDAVDVDIDDVPLGEVSGALALSGTGIPLDGETAVGALTATATVDAAEVQKLRSYISGIDLESITLGEGVVDVATTVDAGFLSLPVTAGIEPSVADGELVFTPRTVSVSGAEISLDDLADGPLRSLARSLVPAQSFCVAEFVPRSIVLTGVDADPRRLQLSFTGESVVLGPALETLGTCA
jgi:hypothetical protein